MKIKIALIPSEHIVEVQELSSKLQVAMESGEMRAVGQATEKLLSFASNAYSLTMLEESWHQLIAQVRTVDGNFKSDYIITKPQLEIIIASRLGDSFVDVVNVVEHALRVDGVVLQLPYEEEKESV